MTRLWRPILVIGLGLSLYGCFGYDGNIHRGYVIDQRMLSQVKPGSSAEQVLVLLGTPSTTSTVGGEAWYYISQEVETPIAFLAPRIVDQNVLAIYFTPNKKVEKIAHYGMKDGRVFDFISRTTPTPGMDRGILARLFSNFTKN